MSKRIRLYGLMTLAVAFAFSLAFVGNVNAADLTVGNLTVTNDAHFQWPIYADGNLIKFKNGNPNYGAMIDFGSGNSSIYDKGDLHIATDDNMYFDFSNQTKAAAYVNGKLFVQNNLVANYPIYATGNEIVFNGSGVVTKPDDGVSRIYKSADNELTVSADVNLDGYSIDNVDSIEANTAEFDTIAGDLTGNVIGNLDGNAESADDSDLLGGHNGAYYLDLANASGTIDESLLPENVVLSDGDTDITGVYTFDNESMSGVPFIVDDSLTGRVDNLNSDMVDGVHAEDLLSVDGGTMDGSIDMDGSDISNVGTFGTTNLNATNASIDGSLNMNNGTVNNVNFVTANSGNLALNSTSGSSLLKGLNTVRVVATNGDITLSAGGDVNVWSKLELSGNDIASVGHITADTVEATNWIGLPAALGSLALTGGTMEGNIEMDGNNITNAANITTDSIDVNGGFGSGGTSINVSVNTEGMFLSNDMTSGKGVGMWADSGIGHLESGVFDMGGGQADLYINTMNNSDIYLGSGQLNIGGDTVSSGDITADTFNGDLNGDVTGDVTGNAATVTNGVYTTDAGIVFLAPDGNGSQLTGLTGDQISGDISGNAESINGTITASQVSDFTAAVNAAETDPAFTFFVTNGGTINGDIDMGGNDITNAGDITADTFNGDLNGDVTGNAATVTNGVYTTDAGIVFLAPDGNGSQLTGLTGDQISGDISGNAESINGTITASQVSDFTAAVNAAETDPAFTFFVTNGGTINGDIDMGGNDITNAGDITADTFNGDLNGDVTGDVTGNAATVTNGVYTTDAGIVFLAPDGNGSQLTGLTGDQISGDISGNAESINGTITASQVSDFTAAVNAAETDPAFTFFVTNGGTINGDIDMGGNDITNAGDITADTFNGDLNGDVTGNAATVTNGVYTTDAGIVFLAPDGNGSQLTGLTGDQISGAVANATDAVNATNADNADTLDSLDSTAFALVGHNHDLTYLGLHATADDSALLQGHNGAYYLDLTNATGILDDARLSANVLLSTATYNDPAWLTSLAGSKITGVVDDATNAVNATNATSATSATSAGNATTVTDGVYTTGSYADPSWITSLDASKITGAISVAGYLKADGTVAMTGDLNLGGNDITNIDTLSVTTINGNLDTAGASILYVGATNATKVEIGKVGIETNIKGSLRADDGSTFAGAAIFNGSVNLNGTTTIGDGGDQISINSSGWDISTAGIATGLTGVTSTGAIDFNGAVSMRIPNKNAAPTCNASYTGGLYYDTTDFHFYGCHSDGIGGFVWTRLDN